MNTQTTRWAPLALSIALAACRSGDVHRIEAVSAREEGALTFQAGASGYDGTKDVAISNQYGGNGITQRGAVMGCYTTTGSSAYTSEVLVKFTDLGLPPGARVTDAKLTITFENWLRDVTIKGFYLKAAWNAEATQLGWLNRDASLAWGQPGARADGVDLISGRSLTFTNFAGKGTEAKTVTLDPAIVQSWIDWPASNQGVILVNQGVGQILRVYGSEAELYRRPLLSITYTTAAPSPPIVTLTTPAENATLTAEATLSATASAEDGIANVQFIIDGAPNGPAVMQPPYNLPVDTNTLTNGAHTLAARATSTSGLSTTSTPISVNVQNLVSGCVTASRASGWLSEAFASQNGLFNIELDATPSATGIDAAFALALGQPAAWTSLAAIVRFNPSGTIDARNYATYAATIPVPYAAGVTYHLRLAVDVQAHKYSVFVRAGSGAEQTVASQFTFRQEQSGVSSLDHTAIGVESASGTLSICGVTMQPATPPPADTSAPSITLTSPNSGATLRGNVTLSASASDNVGVAGVQFLLDGAPFGSEDTTAPYTLTFDTQPLSNGTHTVAARARDAAGNPATTSAVSITIDNATPPPPAATGIAALCGIDPAPAAPPGPLANRTPPVASGTTYYVTASGSATSGCTASQPCREIARAATLVRPGDVVLIGDGTYQRFNIEGLKGTAARPIVFFATGSGARIAPGPNTTFGRYSIYIYGAAHIVFDGLNAAQAPRSAIGLFESQFITVKNGVYADNGVWGLLAGFCDDCAFLHNEFKGSLGQHGLYVSNSGDRHLIRGNLVHDNNQSGIQINADGSIDDSGAYPGEVDGISTGNCIERNVIYNNGAIGGGSLNFDGVQNSIVRNNLIYNNRNTGIANFVQDGVQGPKGMWILNNTIVMPSNGRSGVQFAGSSGRNTMRNNILLHASTSRGGLEVSNSDASLLDSDYNIIERVTLNGSTMPLSNYRTSARESHSASATAASLFVNAAGNDYKLSTSSAARGTGQARSEAPLDIVGLVRNASGGVCIGAYDAP